MNYVRSHAGPAYSRIAHPLRALLKPDAIFPPDEKQKTEHKKTQKKHNVKKEEPETKENQRKTHTNNLTKMQGETKKKDK